MTDTQVLEVLSQAKLVARQYYRLTQRPLGITGEVAEFEAAHHLKLDLCAARTAGYDAIDPFDGRKLQIKGRVVLPKSKSGQRMGSIDITKDFDAVLLVLLDSTYNATAIYEAERQSVLEALLKPGSKSRNQRGALSISKFIQIASKRWDRAAH